MGLDRIARKRTQELLNLHVRVIKSCKELSLGNMY